jgi:3-deoxy-manno-octulosonate cytidylyltransferase (CMP-KDO synthetase)
MQVKSIMLLGIKHSFAILLPLKKVGHMGKVIGIIPARYGSTRLPGKPLIKIGGKSLIQRTYENAKKCKMLDQVIVATDDVRIADHVVSFNGEVVMTSTACITGTDRIIEAMTQGNLNQAELVINIQGDEPNLESDVIEKVISILKADPECDVSTAVVKLESKEDAMSSSVVKCVMDQKNHAIYFSRSLIPGNKTGEWREGTAYYKHLGIYGYRSTFLKEYAELEPTPLQLSEDLEQLKILENGYKIAVAIVKSSAVGVDTPEDIKKIEKLL